MQLLTKHLFLAAAFVALLIPPLFAQPPRLEWQRCLGGTNNDFIGSIIQTDDGGYALSGFTESKDGDVFGNRAFGSDIWFVKLSSTGDVQWQKCLGSNDKHGGEWSRQMIQTFDGGYAIVGGTGLDSNTSDGDVSGSHGGADIWVLKLTQTAEIEWQKCFGGSNSEIGWGIAQAPDSGFVITGETRSKDGDIVGIHKYGDIWTFKISKVGNIQWSKFFGDSLESDSYSIVRASDGGYVFAGVTNSKLNLGDWDDTSAYALIAKLDADGSMVWTQRIRTQNKDIASDIVATSDEGFAVVGYSGQYPENWAWLIKLSPKGTIEWQKTYSQRLAYGIHMLKETADHGFVIAGTMDVAIEGSVHHGKSDLWVMKTDSAGNSQWEQQYGGSGDDAGSGVIQTEDGGFAIVGATESNDGDVIGYHGGQSDAWIIKLSMKDASVNTLSSLDSNSIFFNSASYELFIQSTIASSYKLVDLLGRTILSDRINSELTSVDVIQLPRGLYFVFTEDTRTGHSMFVGKVALVGQ